MCHHRLAKLRFLKLLVKSLYSALLLPTGFLKFGAIYAHCEESDLFQFLSDSRNLEYTSLSIPTTVNLLLAATPLFLGFGKLLRPFPSSHSNAG